MDQTNTNPLQTVLTDANNQFVSVAQDYQQNQSRRGIVWKIAGCVLGVVALMCFACFVGFFALGIWGIQMNKDSLVAELNTKVCLSDDVSIRRVYKENTTPELKKNLSEAEFVRSVKEFSADCKTIKETSVIDGLGKSWTISSDKTDNKSVISFQGKVGNYDAFIELVSESGGEYKINKFDIK